MSWKTPLVRAIAGVVSRRYAVVRQLLREREVAERVLADPHLLKDLFGAKGALRPVFEDASLRESLGLDRSAAGWVDPAAVLQRLSPEEFLALLKQAQARGLVEAADVTAQFGVEAICDTLPPERVVERIGIGPVLECLPPERVVEQLGAERICEVLGVDPIVEHFGLETLLDALVKAHSLKKVMKDKVAPRVAAHDDTDSLLAVFLDRADPEGRHLAAYLAQRPESVRVISRNEEALKHLLMHAETRKRLRLLDSTERAARLGYTLPAVVVSYPRSGSNFLQSILDHSSGMQNASLYADKPWTLVPLLTVKSHALSPRYLEDEWQRLLERDDAPERMLLVKRDPRDVMISFYEYTQVQRRAAIRQDEFLDGIDYFYASTIDRTHNRRVDKGPLSVLEAYRKHITEWFVHRPGSLNVHEISYEDMVLRPMEAFRSALDFLGVDMPVAAPYLQVKVSLYSEESRPRGVVHGWKETREQYTVLLEGVERLLGDEIALLGYERAEERPDARPASPEVPEPAPGD